MDTKLEGRRALIVGGSSGIGRAIAEGLAAEGVDVAIASRGDDNGTLDALRAHGRRSVHLRGDVASECGAETLVSAAETSLGGLDLLVNAAAVRLNEPITRLSARSLEATFATNVAGCIYLCRSAARRFIAGGQGAIVLVGSTATVSAQPGETAYRASKAALRAHLEVMAVELAPFGVRANLVTPGATDTPFIAGLGEARRTRAVEEIPLGREAKPDEIAGAAVFLLSDHLASYITGTELLVDGGLHLRPIFGGSRADLRAMNATDRGSAE
ncbi:MAG: SDR family NAD(P)-dependent oxidoreductase [Candidatus Limnocylindrales bacterium]